MGMDIGAAGFFGLEVDLDGQVAAAFDHKRLGTQVVQILAGDRVSGSDDHAPFLPSTATGKACKKYRLLMLPCKVAGAGVGYCG